MCDFTQLEYSCGHFRWIAAQWCKNYSITHKRCQPPNININNFEYRQDEVCGECKPKTYPPWENMIKRTNKHTYSI